jgi:exoribonuclease-2
MAARRKPASGGRSVAPRDELRRLARQAMRERGLLPEFSPKALDEATALREDGAEAIARRDGLRDLRALPWCSIDNDDSRDLDQLTVAEERKGGGAKVRVAIADVAATVRDRSAIDRHARTNTTSVYTAAEIFPMLPERLCTDLTSLNPGKDRLAVVIELDVAASGAVTASDVGRALVRNHAQLAYPSVAAWLDGTGPQPPRLEGAREVGAAIRLQDRVAQAMKRRRHERGALSLETIETKAVFSGDLLSGLRAESKNRAQELIEDFMVSANGAAVRFLQEKGFPSLRRVLRSPERWARIVDLAADLDAPLPPTPSARALEEFLLQRRDADPERFPDLSLAVVKLLGRGEYVVERPGRGAPGHFGLAVSHYAHSTAPNRRYPDLVTQRLLHAALAKKRVPYGADELDALAAHCTAQEDNAARVERQIQKSAAAMLLADRVGDRFPAIVTGASVKGTWVRILEPPVEGRLVRGFQKLDVGDHVRVELARVDVERGFLDFVR